MADAIDIGGSAFVGGSATLMARVEHTSGELLKVADVATVSYSIFKMDRASGARVDVEGHADVSMTPSNVISDVVHDDAAWTRDAIGYNLRHVLDVATHPAFATVGQYLIEHKIMPVSGQIIIVRFRVNVI